MPQNNNCDGGTAHSSNPQVRVYPLGGGGNLILCRLCWDHENRYRCWRGTETGRHQDWPVESWDHSEIYNQGD